MSNSHEASAPEGGELESANTLYYRMNEIMRDRERFVELGLWEEFKRLHLLYNHTKDESVRACIGEMEAVMYAAKNGTLRRRYRTWKQWGADLLLTTTLVTASIAVVVYVTGHPRPFSSTPTR